MSGAGIKSGFTDLNELVVLDNQGKQSVSYWGQLTRATGEGQSNSLSESSGRWSRCVS